MRSDVNKARTLKAKAKTKATVPRPRPSHNAKVYDNDEVMKSCFFRVLLHAHCGRGQTLKAKAKD